MCVTSMFYDYAMLFTSSSRLHIAKCNKLPNRMNKILWNELNGENNSKHSHIEH